MSSYFPTMVLPAGVSIQNVIDNMTTNSILPELPANLTWDGTDWKYADVIDETPIAILEKKLGDALFKAHTACALQSILLPDFSPPIAALNRQAFIDTLITQLIPDPLPDGLVLVDTAGVESWTYNDGSVIVKLKLAHGDALMHLNGKYAIEDKAKGLPEGILP